MLRERLRQPNPITFEQDERYRRVCNTISGKSGDDDDDGDDASDDGGDNDATMTTTFVRTFFKK